MPIRVDAYMAEGVASGMVVRAGHLRDLLEHLPELALTAVSWQSLDGSAPRAAGDITLADRRRPRRRRRRRPHPLGACRVALDQTRSSARTRVRASSRRCPASTRDAH